ncbi:MAG: 50S ribosomal protein L4, partial [Bacteroidetes bacterium]|nr:50S ribosomal protein L4 [Bacteroidota bacterium]
VPEKNDVILKSGRNIPGLQIIEASRISTYDIMNNHVLLLQKSAVQSLENTF